MIGTATPGRAPTRRRKEPFAALPHHIAGDSRVSPLGKVILLALLYWARDKDHCWPADASIGRRIGRSEATVQRGLRHLEELRLIERLRTINTHTGRVIRLTWRSRSDEGPALSGMRDTPPSPVRDKEDIVIVKGDPSKKVEDASSKRQRPEAPVPSGETKGTRPLAAALTEVFGRSARRSDPEVGRETPSPEASPPKVPQPPARKLGTATSTPGTARCATSASCKSVARPESTGPTTKTVVPAPPDHRTLELLTPPEQVRFWEASEAIQKRVLQWLKLSDPICLGEVRRLLASPQPPEPPPQALGTEMLLSGLPGRPDRVAAAAGRLAEELGDPRSYRYYQSVAELVCRREQPPESLITAWRQGRDPRSSRPGAVFATAWKREVRLRN